jgi:GlpG protein
LGRPWLTYAACAFCVLVFVGITLEGSEPDWDALSKWGAPRPDRIWDGAYWALVSSCFVHVEVWHLVFNVYWLWVLGGTLERLLGAPRWLAFFLASAVTSSGLQLGSSGVTGIGMSGVVYAMFGFLWVAARRRPELRRVLARNTVYLFFFWLVGCVVADAAGIVEIGNMAHVSGLLFGALFGLAHVTSPPRRRWGLAAAAGLLALSIVPLFWCPWSFYWVAHRAVQAHERADYAKAIRYYERSLEMAVDPVWSLRNLAWAYYATGVRERFTATMIHLRKIDRKAAETLEGEILALQAAKPPD